MTDYLHEKIQILRPGVVILEDYYTQSDGGPTYIASWTDARPQPTQTELDSVSDQDAQSFRESTDALQQLKEMDRDMARIVEDIYNVLTPDQKAALPAEAVNKINARQSLRQTGMAARELLQEPRKNGK